LGVLIDLLLAASHPVHGCFFMTIDH